MSGSPLVIWCNLSTAFLCNIVSYSACSSGDIARTAGATESKGLVYKEVSQIKGMECPTLIHKENILQESSR